MKGNGKFYVGVAEYDKKKITSLEKMRNPTKYNATYDLLLPVIRVNYGLRVTATGCYYYNYTLNNNSWTAAGLEVNFHFQITD